MVSRLIEFSTTQVYSPISDQLKLFKISSPPGPDLKINITHCFYILLQNHLKGFVYFAPWIDVGVYCVAKIVLPVLSVWYAICCYAGYHYSRAHYLRNNWTPFRYPGLSLGTLNRPT